MPIEIISLNIGKPQLLHYKEERIETGIFKTRVENQSLDLSRHGFLGDGQADLAHHGGPDKAICVYAYEHYPYWEQELQTTLSYGAFGENLTLSGVTEDEVCIGDIFAIGEVRLQVSQPRQPCHKLAKRHNRPDLPLLVQNNGFTGYYFRVLVPGAFERSHPLVLLEPHPDSVTVGFANQIYYHRKNDQDGIRSLLGISALSDSWRRALEQRLL